MDWHGKRKEGKFDLAVKPLLPVVILARGFTQHKNRPGYSIADCNASFMDAQGEIFRKLLLARRRQGELES